ncbi:restriction endonuclease subunit S [Legionella longbeachae]|uniref:restriction endonuclease subunit S n=1 Tax=Legionella longbeachae TaxID=450 RepID=UPI001C1C09AE|nr:restriction endonuclease subunit S [Legionella pneumophila]
MSNLYCIRDLAITTLKGITPKYVDFSQVLVLNQKCIRNFNICYEFAQYHDSNKSFPVNKVVRVGDILINSTGKGTAGRIAFVKELPSELTVIVDSHILILRSIEFYTAGCLAYSLYNIEYLLQTFLDGSTGQGEFDKQRLFNIFTALPLIEKRENTYKLLSYFDKKIELNNRINAELEAMAKLIYDYWFVQFEFPDVNGKPYKSSGGKMDYKHELNWEIPIDWKVGYCSELFKFNPSLSIKKGKICPYIDMNSLPTAGFMTSTPTQKSFSGGMKFQNGDVLLARITPCLENGKTGLVSLLEKDDEIGFGSTEFIVLRGKNFDLRCFGSCLARSEKFRKYAISKMTGTSGRKRVNYTDLESYIIPIPDETLLRKFEDLLSPFFKIMTNNIKENQILSDLRDWLLPMLMNGQVIVK